MTDSIDATLGVIDPEFTPLSDVRIDGWLRIVFLPFEHKDGEALTNEMQNRWNLVGKLADFGDDPPDKVTQKLLLELSRPSWPLEFRVRLAGVLQRLYLAARTANPKWAAALNDFYPATLGQANSSDLSLIASALAIGNEIPATSTQLRFEPNDKTVAAVQASLQRMRALAASDPNDPHALSAIAGLERALGARKE